jgi:hypothetical protein
MKLSEWMSADTLASLSVSRSFSMKSKVLQFAIGAIAFATASAAEAANYTGIDLSAYVNEGFTNSWFNNGDQFAPIIGTTTGNQGTGIPFSVANPSDGNGGNNNFWFGLYSGPGSLAGPPGSVTIPVTVDGVTTVYTLTDNTFGVAGNTEFSITFNGAGGPLTENYVGANNTKDYNLNCSTTGCASTPNAQYWFVDTADAQWLQVQQWVLPAAFGLTSVTFNQVDLGDGAIVAGLTVSSATPLPSTWTMMLLGLLGGGSLFYRRRQHGLDTDLATA